MLQMTKTTYANIYVCKRYRVEIFIISALNIFTISTRIAVKTIPGYWFPYDSNRTKSLKPVPKQTHISKQFSSDCSNDRIPSLKQDSDESLRGRDKLRTKAKAGAKLKQMRTKVNQSILKLTNCVKQYL